MRRCYWLVSCLLSAALTAGAQQAKPAAPAAPAPPPLVMQLASHPDWPAAKNPADVDTVDHILGALYDVISGPPGQRDWTRFKSLFLPDGRIGVVVPATPATPAGKAPDGSPTPARPAQAGDAVFLSPGMYEERDDPYFKTHGFFEHAIANRVEEFGNLVQVWSTYESRNAKEDAKPFSRGINSIQIVHARGRFWIASILFDDEREGLVLPDKYLK